MRFAYGQRVKVRREVRDEFHGDETHTEERFVEDVFWWPRTSAEGAGIAGVGSDLRTARLTTGLTMVAPVGSGITARHRVILPAGGPGEPWVDGPEYRVEGAPGSWRSPLTGWEPGVQIELERVEG